MARFTDEQIEERLSQLPGWTRDGSTIRRDFTFPDFKGALAFVNQVGERAEAADHHPDLTIEYNRVRLVLTTHSVGRLTNRDFKLATEINQLA